MRKRAGLKVDDLGAPMDVLWMRISRFPEDDLLVHIEAGRMLIMIDRGDYWQCAFVIEGLAADLMKTKSAISQDDPGAFAGSAAASTRTARLGRRQAACRRGRSPVAMVSAGFAVHRRFAHACRDPAASGSISPCRTPWRRPIFSPAAAQGTVTVDHLKRVQARREWPTRVIQRIQIAAQNRIIGPVLAGTLRPKPPAAVKLLNWFPALRRLPARLIGIGVRPEHIRTPEIISGTKNPST